MCHGNYEVAVRRGEGFYLDGSWVIQEYALSQMAGRNYTTYMEQWHLAAQQRTEACECGLK